MNLLNFLDVLSSILNLSVKTPVLIGVVDGSEEGEAEPEVDVVVAPAAQGDFSDVEEVKIA